MEMKKLSHNSVVVLDDDQFNKYVVERTRDFDVLLLFSFTRNKQACSTCVYDLNRS